MTPRTTGDAAKPMSGTLPLNRDVFERVMESLRLPPQQVKIVELVLCGQRDKQIASSLSLRVPTVRTHLSRIFFRLGVQDRVELILHIVAAAESLRDVPSRRS